MEDKEKDRGNSERSESEQIESLLWGIIDLQRKAYLEGRASVEVK